jgi:hypothetical protein
MKKLLLIAFSFMSVPLLFSQAEKSKELQKEQDSLAQKKSYGQFALEYNSNSVYLGRKDSLGTPYLSPTLGYYDKSGLFIEGNLSYLMRSGDSRIDETTIRGGWDFSKGNFSGELAAEKNFYNSSSTNVKSEVKGSISFLASYDFGVIETMLTPGVNFGNKNDFTLQWQVDHPFTADEEKFSITPSFLLNGSTRNFYGSYFGKRRLKKKGQTATVTAVVNDASKFKIMDYELSLPLSYTLNRFTFGINPTYAIPQNPAVLTVTVKPPAGPAVIHTVNEQIENVFFIELSASIKF